MAILLTRTQDILGWLGEHKSANQTLVGFSMETENLIENSRAKLLKKHADLICANSIAGGHTGFAVDTNKVTLITNETVTEQPLCCKEETADKILDFIATLS
jgi:phosphopantothenoylcysteine decarboxylase/phosphopantothenate--cysteine ligase